MVTSDYISCTYVRKLNQEKFVLSWLAGKNRRIIGSLVKETGYGLLLEWKNEFML